MLEYSSDKEKGTDRKGERGKEPAVSPRIWSPAGREGETLPMMDIAHRV